MPEPEGSEGLAFEPDNVHETGVSLDGQSGSPCGAEAQQVDQLEEDLVTAQSEFLCPARSNRIASLTSRAGVAT
jgi:hypothetical protein